MSDPVRRAGIAHHAVARRPQALITMSLAVLGFSSSSQPDAFWLRVYGERMQATANLFETRLTFDGPRNVPKPLRPFFSALEEGKTIRRAALATRLRKFKGPGAYEGLWELLARTYRALADGSALDRKSV